MNNRQPKTEELFEEALSLSREQRAAFLKVACRGAPELQRAVEDLLAENDRLSGFLADSPLKELKDTAVSGTSAHRLQANSRLGRYLILEPLGSGGMGVVYRARDEKLQRLVAIKMLASGVLSGEEARRQFRREALALAKLNHPRIAAVYDVGEQDGADFIVMELLEGNTLRQVLKRGPIPVRKAIEYSVQIAHGLAAAHDKGIVHRDLKPENLFVSKEGQIKILDFGLAKSTQRQPGYGDETRRTTEPGVIMGTVGYMSPEQVRGETIDHRTDIFAFGAVLYEMLAGKRAFDRSTGAETLTAILNEEPPSIPEIVQPGLDRVIHRCLEKSPEQRFQSASDLAFALEALSDGGSGRIAAPAQDARSRWVWVIATVVAAILIAAVVVWWRMPAAVPVVESATQVTDDGQPKANITSDGSRIYFNEGPTDSQGLAQVSVAGGPTARVETRFPNCILIGMLQDGSALLAIVGSQTESTLALDPLWLIPLPAGEPRRVGNFGLDNADVLPDGRIVFNRLGLATDAKGRDFRADWFIAEKDGSNPRKLISLSGFVGFIAAPHSGQRILLTQEQTSDRKLLEINADGTGLHEIRKLTDERNFRWSLDGKYVVYESGTAPESDIWLLPMQTGLFRRPGKPIRLTNGPLPYSFPTPSRDGKQIFALGTKRRGELVRYDMKSHQFLPFLSGISATDPTFSRDGTWIAYASYPDHTLWRIRSDGSDRMQLTFPPLDVNYPAISPDGRKVTFHTGNSELYVIDMQGGEPQKVAEHGVCPGWSSDGNYLLYGTTAPPASVVIKDLRTGESFPLPSSEGMSSGFWLSQDEVIVRNASGTKFVVFNLKTRQWTDLPGGPSGSLVNFFPSQDGKYLYYTTGGAEPKALRYSFADRRIETITSLKDVRRAVNSGNTQIDVAPDGSPIFTRDTGYQEIFALNVRWP